MAMICQGAPHLFGDVLHDHLLGMITTYLRDSDNQVNICTLVTHGERHPEISIPAQGPRPIQKISRQPFRPPDRFPRPSYRNAARITGPIDEFLFFFLPPGVLARYD